MKDEIEKIYDEMREEKKATEEVIERIRAIQRKLEKREAEKERLKEIFPVFDVLRDYFTDLTKVQDVSKEIVHELETKDLLNKESFLKGRQRKAIRRIVREGVIRNFGLVEKIDEIDRRIFANLEETYE